MFKKKWAILFALVLTCFVCMQFMRPTLRNPPVTADLSAPPEVEQILKRACYDCHSNETKLAWFDKIMPAYWLVAGHIKDGRKVLNFSNWDSLAPGDQKGKLFEALNQIQFENMPISSYTLVHPKSKVTVEEFGILKNYIATLSAPSKTADTAKLNAANKQYNNWTNSAAVLNVKPEPNGVNYVPGYKDWKIISTTDRFDNGTMRVIFGNDVAVKAIKEQHINPWPDGAIFAKVAWYQLRDSLGNVRTGEFKQVEFMIKDKNKYASTDGWGFGRWLGMGLKPYGKNALLSTECMTCHEPMKNNDFMFTEPLNLSAKN